MAPETSISLFSSFPPVVPLVHLALEIRKDHRRREFLHPLPYRVNDGDKGGSGTHALIEPIELCVERGGALRLSGRQGNHGYHGRCHQYRLYRRILHLLHLLLC